MPWAAGPGRSGRTGEEGTGVLGVLGAGRRCFVAKVTPEGVRRDLAREAAGNLAKRHHIGQATYGPGTVPAQYGSLARFLTGLDKLVDGIRAQFVAFGEGRDGRPT